MTVTLTSAGGSGSPAPSQSILLNATQTSIGPTTVTVAIPAGTYSAVSDFPMMLTINSVPFLIQGGSTPTVFTTTASATSCSIINLSLGLNLANKTFPVSMVAIAWSATAGVFVALPTASGAVCYTSPDGVTWTSRTMPSTNAWTSIAVNSAGLFCAVGNTSGTAAATSPDGITWTARTLPSTATWCSIAYNGTNFVAIPSNAANTAAASSPDGITWTARTLPTSAQWQQVVALGGTFLASSTTTAWATSPDGTTWTARTGPGAGAGTFGVAVGNSLFVTAISNVCYTSPDGITWTTRNFPSTIGFQYAPGVFAPPIFVNGVFMCAASNSTYNTYIGTIYYVLISPDGINWTPKQALWNTNIMNGQNAYASNSSVSLIINNSAYYIGTLAPNPFGIYSQPTTTY